MKNKNKKNKPKKFPMTKFLKISTVYFVLFIALFGMVDYYAMMAYSFLWVFVISLIIAVPLGYYHVKRGKRDHVDDIANEFL